jgi:hypothetical protein
MMMFGEMFRDNAPLTAVHADPEGANGEDGLSLATITGQ